MTSAVVCAYSEVGVRCLQVLLRHGVKVALVLTHPDDPTEQRWFGSVAELAAEHGLAVEMPEDPNEKACVQTITRLHPTFLFSFYYRHMLCTELLAAPTRGALNMHGSLLPKYRGRAPVNWAILKGETQTGASLHYMEARPDAGALVGQEAVPILINDTAMDVSLKVADAAERLLERSLPTLIDGSVVATPLLLEQGSYFGRRRPEDGEIQWDRSALEIHNLIRAVAPPFPGAFGRCGPQSLRVLGSRYFDRAALHPRLAPCLYVADGKLQLDCRDGKSLTLTDVELDGAPLTPEVWSAQLGSRPLSLSSREVESHS